MTSAPDVAEPVENSPKKSKLPMLIGLVLAIVGAAGGFIGSRSGMLAPKTEDIAKEPKAVQTEAVTFVPVPAITVSFPSGSSRELLRLTAQLDVAPSNADKITQIMPRITDILTGYLRAVQPADFEEPAALPRLRMQMLHRVNVVAGEGVVRDLLITEFILN